MASNTFTAPTNSLQVVCRSGNIYTASMGLIFDVAGNDVPDVLAAGCVPTSQAPASASVKEITTGASYSFERGVETILVNKTTGSATAIVLDVTKMVKGKPVAIFDKKGDAATNNITITEASGAKLNGASSFVLDDNNQVINATYDGSAIVLS